MKSIKILLLMAPLICIVASCGQKAAASKAADTDIIPVKVMSLDKEARQNTITVSGQFTTDDEVYLSFKTNGVIDRIYVKEGDAVKKGQVLATLKLTEINAQVQQAQLAYEKAKRDYERTDNLYKDSVATLEQQQNTKTALDMAKQQLDAASFNRSYAVIRANEDGFVLRKMANEGQVVSAGTPVLQANGARSDAWLLRVGVSDKEWSLIGTGDTAKVSTASQPGKAMTGVVTHRSEGVDPATGSFTIDIKLTGEKQPAIAAGMYGKAVISTTATASQKGVWAIPYDALLDGDGSIGYVFITNDGKTAEKLKVTIAGMEKDDVLISDGLQSAHTLIISGSAYLNEHSPIHIIQ